MVVGLATAAVCNASLIQEMASHVGRDMAAHSNLRAPAQSDNNFGH